MKHKRVIYILLLYAMVINITWAWLCYYWLVFLLETTVKITQIFQSMDINILVSRLADNPHFLIMLLYKIFMESVMNAEL